MTNNETDKPVSSRRSLRRKKLEDLSKEELLERARKYESQKFSKTGYFKRRMTIILAGLFLTFIAAPNIPTATSSDTNFYSYVLLIAFLAVLFAIDHLVLGYYYFSRDKKIGD